MNDPGSPQHREAVASWRHGASASNPFPAASMAPALSENEISRFVVDSAIEVHRTLGGPGLIERVYEEALAWELRDRGLEVRRQMPMPITYKGHTLGRSLRPDILINARVIVECKATTQYNSIFEAQMLTYLRITGLRLGIVINFGERTVARGIHRVVNGL